MTYSLLINLFLLLSSFATDAQHIQYEGTYPPDTAVLKLLDEYAAIFEENKNVGERDAKRKAMVSPAYFYHGMDGAPIGLEGLTKRQTKNEFKLIADSVYDQVLYQYEHTAIFVFKEWQHLVDKGIEKEHTNSVLIVMSKEEGRWKILSDVIGQKPKGSIPGKIISQKK